MYFNMNTTIVNPPLRYNEKITMQRIKFSPVTFCNILFVMSLASVLIDLFVINSIEQTDYFAVRNVKGEDSSSSHVQSQTNINSKRHVIVSASPVPERSGRPPIHGSMFGKRSLRKLQPLDSSSQISNKQLGDNSIVGNKEVINNKKQQSQSTTPAPSYQEIVTNIIEDFMRNNQNDNSNEVVVSFCRMIIIECNQILQKDQRLQRR